ncbi:MAG TPA: methyltransferase, partial [Solirubrobacteraceae bacterium]|nr:methyltransferase [Solirubrobacteraceae bacterium]
MVPQRPHEAVWTLANAFVASRCLHVVAALGVADAIGDDPVPAPELASRCGADADALGRVLRLMAAHGIFEADGGGFRHTPASRLLRSDHPTSMRAGVAMMGLPVYTATFARLEHSLRTGSPAVETVEPRGVWAYLQDHPDEAEAFGHGMTAKAAVDIAAVLDAYDFSRFATIADIGGGRGHLLRAILDAAPAARGVLFDRPQVIGALEFAHDRLTPQAGDFFVDPLPAADAYVLMEVIHDWPDAEALAILGAVRAAAGAGATLLVIETVLPERGADPGGQSLDVMMLAMTGGRERTARHLGELFASSGFGDP